MRGLVFKRKVTRNAQFDFGAASLSTPDSKPPAGFLQRAPAFPAGPNVHRDLIARGVIRFLCRRRELIADSAATHNPTRLQCSLPQRV